ncbi:MAG TPA: hypothetical protein VEI46_10190 [Thermodesulfovibrionales bacterium]|nr:hypothetical protein [Thermodesulfovibrionales bacterium]
MKSERSTQQRESLAFPMHSVALIKEGVEQGMSFDQACSLVAIKEQELREVVLTSALKAIVSEMHFSKKIPLRQLAMKLGVSLSRVINAKERILKDEEAAASDKMEGTGGSHDVAP